MSTAVKNNTRANEFRFVYTNTFGMTFGPTEVQILFGIQHKTGSPDPSMEEQVGVIFTHAGAKLLVEMLKIVLDDYEEYLGTPIPFENQKLDVLREKVATAKKQRQAEAAKSNQDAQSPT